MEPVAVLDASQRHASGIRFSPDGALLVTGGMEGALKVWDTNDWALVREVAGHTACVNSIGWHGDQAITAASDKTVRLWNLPEWDEARRIPHFAGAVSLDDALILRKDRGDRVYRYDLGEGKATAAVATGLNRFGGIWRAGPYVATGGVDPVVQLRDPTDLSVIAELDGHGTAATNVSATAAGDRSLSSDYDGGVHLWDLATHERIATLELGTPGYFFAAISPDGRHIATGAEGRVGLHTIDGATTDTHELGIKGVYNVCWAPDGTHVANAAADGKVRVYKVA